MSRNFSQIVEFEFKYQFVIQYSADSH